MTVRRLTTTGALATLVGLAFGAVPAFATDVDIDTNTGGFGSTVEIVDNDDNADVVSVQISGPLVIVTDTGPGGAAPNDASCSVINAQNVSCPLVPPPDPPPADPFDPIRHVEFQANGGPDALNATPPTMSVDATGGDGPDTLTGGPLDDFLSGEDGIDQLTSLGGDDNLSGGEGNDALSAGDGEDNLGGGGSNFNTGGTDVLDGGAGSDFAGYFRATSVNVSLDDVANDGFPGENDNLIAIEDTEGGDGDDILTGNDSPNEIFGNDGNDTIRSLGGSDEVFGDDGDDLIDGGGAADGITCGNGVDTALVDPDDDVGIDCERSGARASLDTVAVDGKGIAKVPVTCPATEAADCEGKVRLLVNGKSIGKGKFKAPVGETKKAKVKLSKKGKKTLKKNNGTLLAQAEVETTLGGGSSTTADTVLLRQKAKKGGKK